MENKVRKAEIELEYQPYFDYHPMAAKQLFSEACESDEITVGSWKKTWLANIKANFEKFGSFSGHSLGEVYGKAHMQPVIVAGSGPSLKNSIKGLKNRGDIKLLSCLHNFHFMEDNDLKPDYYVSLDAGEVVIEEVYEGGSKTPDEYWNITKDRTLLCYIGTSPRLLDKWQGKVLFFNCPVPDEEILKKTEDLEIFNVFVSNGGNVLGACAYIAKSFLGCSVLGFVGADFAFSYDKKFHGWESKYDLKLGNVMRVTDVYGLPVHTWKSYHNFKGWFEWLSMTVPGFYVNCSEGGILGAYKEGNIRSIIQIPLEKFVRQINQYSEIKEQCDNPKCKERKILF